MQGKAIEASHFAACKKLNLETVNSENNANVLASVLDDSHWHSGPQELPKHFVHKSIRMMMTTFINEGDDLGQDEVVDWL